MLKNWSYLLYFYSKAILVYSSYYVPLKQPTNTGLIIQATMLQFFT